MSNRVQRKVVEAVEQRGYRTGWNAEQFFARQIAKMQEELGELVRYVRDNRNLDICEESDLEFYIKRASQKARQIFDQEEMWIYAGIQQDDGITKKIKCEIMSKLADMQVVLYVMAEAFSEITSEPFDIETTALVKATNDIERGVRNEN